MQKKFLSTAFVALFFIATSSSALAQANSIKQSSDLAIATFAGGCFWCIEADFEKLEGVIEAVSGYTGGSAETANYKTVTQKETGHYEAVEIQYDPAVISYAELVEYFWRHIDPTDPNGQFCDKGTSYRSAIFYGDENEKKIVEESLLKLTKNKPFNDEIVTYIGPSQAFYIAETYHQNYYKKNPIRYNFYRRGCGRDARVRELWGDE